MGKAKPVCPDCGENTFIIRQTFALKGDCHFLERRRFAYYKCKSCGCEYLLTIPQGKLEKIKCGKVTVEMAEKVLMALNLPIELIEKLKEE